LVSTEVRLSGRKYWESNKRLALRGKGPPGAESLRSNVKEREADFRSSLKERRTVGKEGNLKDAIR